MPARRFWILAVLLMSVALAVRAGVALWWQDRLAGTDQQFAMGDSHGYWYLAGTIAAGQPYQYGSPDAAVFRAPGYPWMLSWLVGTRDPAASLLAARLLGCALGTAAVGIVIAVTARFFDRGTALVAGVLASFYPGGITTSVLILSEAPFMPLMMLVLALLARRNSYAGALGAGAVSGLAILVRPSWLLFLPFYYAWCVLADSDRLRQIRFALCAGASAAVVMMPWWIRNYQRTGHFVPTTLQVGASLYDGLNPRATGASDTDMEFSITFARALRQEVARSGTTGESFEYQLNRRLANSAVTWAVEHPLQALRLAVVKVARTWWPWPSAADLPGGAAVRWIFAIGCLGLLVPGATYAISHRCWSSQLRPFLVPVLYFTLLHAVFVGSIRYRQPALFALTVLAAPQYVSWVHRWRGASRPEPAETVKLT